MSHEIPCRFRHDIRNSDNKERATCGLLQKLLNDDTKGGSSLCEVDRDACVACCRSEPTTSDLVGGAFSSILSDACDKKLLNASTEVAGPSRAAKLGQAAEDAVLEFAVAPQLTDCDVILWCEKVDQFTHSAIASIFKQYRAEVTIHFVVPSHAGRSQHSDLTELIERYRSHYNFVVHSIPEAQCSLNALQTLAPSLRSEFVAIQSSNCSSFPNRIHSAVAELRRLGADFVISPMLTPDGLVEIEEAEAHSSSADLPLQTLVLRRASFIDLGGIANSQHEAAELLTRARGAGASVASLPWPTVELLAAGCDFEDENALVKDLSRGAEKQQAVGYSYSRVECDVVLPVYGQLDFVRPAIESVIEQENADVIVHMIDDCGPEDVTDLFRYWGSHPQVRLYRNTRNIGQYTSFNNVSEYFETDLVAVQDGDDISLPHRLFVSGNLLELSGADYFAAAMEQFGTDEALPIRRSGYPSRKNSPYFAMNPTACFRVSMFRDLGGYADFGAHERNRGGMDTEFMNRAYWSQRRFAISNSIVTRRRIHAEAATRRADTGFGSSLRNQAIRETHRRIALMRTQGFSPRYFGGLGNHRQLTQRIN